jgi:hypothetical protein
MTTKWRIWSILISLLALSSSLLTAALAEEHRSTSIPPPEILGVRLAMPYAAAHAQLAKLGQLQKEDEGQEVWRLLGDEHYQFLIVGFDAERRVRYVTALAEANATPLKYDEVGDLGKAARTGQPGNLTFTWKGEDKKAKLEYLAIAKGKDPQRLSSFSVKRLGVRGEED